MKLKSHIGIFAIALIRMTVCTINIQIRTYSCFQIFRFIIPRNYRVYIGRDVTVEVSHFYPFCQLILIAIAILEQTVQILGFWANWERNFVFVMAGKTFGERWYSINDVL